MGLRLKLYAPLILSAVLLFVSIHQYILPYFEDLERSEHIEHIQTMLATIAISITEHIRDFEYSNVNHTLAEVYRLNPNWVTFEFYNEFDAIIFEKQALANTLDESSLLSLDYPLTYDGNEIATLHVKYDLRNDFQTTRAKFVQYQQYIAGFLMALFLIFYVMIEIAIMRPVRLLRKASSDVASKDYGSKIDVASSDELGLLVKDFCAMRQSIRENEEELYKTNQMLEHTVKVRNRDLQNQKFALDEHAIVAATDRSGKIVYANEKFCELSGYDQSVLLGQNHRILNSGTHPREFFADMWRTIASGKVWKGDICNRAKDGHLYWVASTIVPFLDCSGKPYQYVAIRTDITERIRQEEQLRDSHQAILVANRAKDKFLGVMSHEIRTPMNGMMGVLDMLEDTVLNSEQLEYIRLARNVTSELLNMLNQTLDYTKLEAGRVELEEIAFDPKMLCLELYNFYRQKTACKQLEFQYIVDDGMPDCVLGDPIRIRQILGNLIDNAIKFTGAGGITLNVRMLSHDATSCRLLFDVRDTGIGVSAVQQERIFAAFAQADSSTTRQYGGTGLGLAIVEKLVKCMQGKITLTSECGAGTTFSVELPFRYPDALTDYGDNPAVVRASSGD